VPHGNATFPDAMSAETERATVIDTPAGVTTDIALASRRA
jgi:hypothetical protein